METISPRQRSIVEIFRKAQEGRDFSTMAWQMNAASEDKANSIFPFFKIQREGAIIVDKGSGTGQVAELAGKQFREAKIYAVDTSHEFMEMADQDKALIRLVYGNVLTQIFPDNTVDEEYFSTCLHEPESDQPGAAYTALAITFNELIPGGQVVVRDFAKPERKEPIYMKIISNVGEDVPKNAKPEDIDYTRLSTRALLERFKLEFRGGGQFDYEEVEIEGEKYIKIEPEWAAEFYLRKDYVGNWRQELHEKYMYWTPIEAVQKLNGLGYVNTKVTPDPNAYILNNRLYGKIALYEMGEDGKLKDYDFPITHMVFSGEKPDGEGKMAKPQELPFVNYKDLFATIKIDTGAGVVQIGEEKFEVIHGEPIIGTKKLIFRLKDRPKEILKVVRGDTRNDHNVFKSMFQTIERQRVLREMGTPHLPILDYDQKGPPYRYLIQEAAPEGSVNAADLIKEGKLTETDIRQIAEIVNRYEKGKTWQLDTNPFSWFRITKEDGRTEMIYASSKVYSYDERWEFRRVGLLQWLDPIYVENARRLSAAIPKEKEYETLINNWGAPNDQISSWRKYLDPQVSPA